MSTDPFVLIPAEAQRRLKDATDCNQDLTSICEAQTEIINDLAVSLPDPDVMNRDTEKMDEELLALNKQIQNAQEYLVELMTQPDQEEQDPGIILKNVIDNLVKLLSHYSRKSLDEGQMGVSILQLLDTEDQIARVIEDMEEKGLYPEGEEQLQQRQDRLKKHNEKIVEFLELLKKQTE